MWDLNGATVVITGASSGIGQATAQAFAARGARLVLAARDGEALKRVAGACEALGAEAITVPTDVTDAAAVQQLATQARALGDKIDIWVSNAGVGAVGLFQETPIAAHEQVIRTNLIGHINDAHAVLPIFLAQGYGIFINMISLGGVMGTPFATAYAASKHGLRGFSEALRGELVDYPEIHICDVYPSFVDTPGLSHGANYAGRALSAPPPVYDARTVAAAIVETAQRPRPTVTVGVAAQAIRLCHFLAPELTTRLLGRFMAAYLRRARGIPITDGNLYAPPADAGGIDGGLRRPQERAVTGATALAVGVGLLALVVLVRRKPAPRRR